MTMAESSEGYGVEPVALVGLACRVPGARDAEQFWTNLANGVESVRMFTLEEQRKMGVRDEVVDDTAFVPAALVLDDVEHFDAPFFGMTEREAQLTDPQHRLFLELAHTALEDAGYDPARYPGAVAVYGGAGPNDYQWRHLMRNPRVLTSGGMAVSVGNSPDYLTTFTSYKLNLRGPSFSLHTACSTSLVALHLACEALRNGECDLALAGGVCIELPQGHGYIYYDGGITSPDGHCRPFDAAAAGTMWGSGGGVVVLKRLSDALADGDRVRAVVLGNAVNNDGAAKVGFSAPSAEGQAEVVAQALGVAGVPPRSVTYVEAHGTGTHLGDPIEVAALSRAYGEGSDERGWCALGSVKSNIGHLSQGAGVVAVIKTVLAMEHGLIPASLNYETPNPAIDFETSPFYVNAALSVWNRDSSPRRAGISSFGIGGTNAHVVLEEPPAPVAGTAGRPAQLLQVSARTATALNRAVDRLAGHLAAQPDADLADVAYTLRVGRGRHRHRAAVVATDTADAVAGLRDKKRRHTGEAPGVVPRVAFLFSGQGAQFAGMAAQLYQVEPVFREAVDSCAETLRPELDGDLREWMFSTGDQEAEERLRQTRYTQPALFVVEYALARLWESWGVRPSAMIGHSIGEYVAATLAGVFTLPDALRLVAARGRLMQELPAGAMLAVQAGEERVAADLPEGLSVAVVNGPGTCVVAGPPDDVARYAETLRERKIGSRPLRTSHAFHSPMMDPILDEFTALVAAVPRQAPQAPFLSNRTGDWVTAEQVTDPAYWAGHLRHTVRFGECVARLLAGDDDWVMVECGPGRQLTGLARMQVPKGGAAPLPSLPGPGDRKGDLQVLYDAAGRLWVAGVELDDAFGGPGRRVPLPTYPFERSYHWVEPEPGAAAAAAAPAQAGPPRNLPMSQWCSVPVWQQLPPVAEAAAPARCLVFTDGPAGAALADALTAAGAVVTRVVPGTGYGRDEQGRFTVRRTERDDYVALLEELGRGGGVPARMVHAWCLADGGAALPDGGPALSGDALGADDAAAAADDDVVAAATDDDVVAAAVAAQDRGFYSLLALSQALGAVDLPEPVHLDVVTAGTRDVVGGDVTRPEHATVAGIVMVLPLELPGTVSVRHIDADAATGAVAAGTAVAGEVRVPPAGEQGEAVALRRGRRWRPALTSVPLPEGGSGLRTGGVYLVTGGLGGIGLTLAEDLAGQVGARLVLLSRTALPPREEWDAYLAGAAVPGGAGGPGPVDAADGAAGRTVRSIAAIRRIEAAGGEVLVLPADVADVAGLRRVREEVLARFGRLDGIVHAAGLPGGGLVETKTRAAAETVLAPKLAGSLALAAAFGDLDLDFVALCSSVTGVYGGLGQVDYCAASAFLDALAHSGQGFSGRVLSIDWGGWLEVGMAVDVVAPDVLGQTANVRTGVTAALPAEPVDHPLITSRHGSGGGPAWCAGLLDPSRHWVLSEHRIAGAPVMPGTAHLELARAAVAAVVPRPSAGAVVQLRDVTFLRPLAVADGSVAEVRVLLEPIDDGMAFQVTSGGEVYADGTGGWVVPGPVSDLDLDAVRARCGPAQDLLPGHYESITGLLTFGPRWASLRRIQAGDGEALGLFEAPDQVAAELDRWPLHPAMLDEATSFAGGEGGNRLPLGYGRVTVHRTMPPRVWAYARTRTGGGELETSDILLVDDDGRVVTEITEFMLRRIDPDAVATSVTERPTEVPERRAEALADTIGIRPAEGAEVFRRLLSADLGAQVVVAARSVADSLARVRAVTTQTVTEQLDAARSGGPGGEGGRAAGTELESVLAAVWSQVLGVAEVGPDDDFFELGGNSLVAVQLIGQVRKAVNVRLPMRSLFEASTVAAMAALVEQLRGAEEAAAEPAPATSAVTIPRLARPDE